MRSWKIKCARCPKIIILPYPPHEADDPYLCDECDAIMTKICKLPEREK